MTVTGGTPPISFIAALSNCLPAEVCWLAAGKSVSIPQWAYDNSHPDNKVAVLVSGKATAEGLAQHISQLRGCTVGQEVGLGVSGRTHMSDASHIIFLSYDYFSTISAADATLSSWGVVIMDDAHERTAKADAIFVKLLSACKVRPELKVVIMSAFMDAAIFADSLRKNSISTQTLDVPGVMFPIRDEWFCEEPWNPSARGAIQTLALECVRVHLQVCVLISHTHDEHIVRSAGKTCQFEMLQHRFSVIQL